MTWSHSEYCDLLQAETGRFYEAVRGADMAAPVATCPPWDVAELVRHLGGIYRWSSQMVAEGRTERLSFGAVKWDLADGKPADPEWFKGSAELMLQRLRAAKPDQPAWAWGADQHARFWSRRLVHETGVHRADAELAVGRMPAFEPAIAVDGVDEFLDNLPHATFAPHIKELHGQGSLHFHCTDAEGEWLIQLTPNGFDWQHGHAKGDVAVRATASDLLLLVYGRVEPDPARFQVFGDEALLQRWLKLSPI
ncbi:MAG: maleylpyruvate isomerase family mycothiol-dependent enzyme [Chloroflexi bacterium]|nr:maleylpyruvate isomerase family mycothiol-dependent enzyme [Chloroflexota bacterium]